MGNVPDDVRGPRPYDPSRDLKDYVQEARDRWKFRRLMIFGAAILLGILLLILAGTGNEAMFANAIWALVALVSIYIGAPVADDFLQTRPGFARAA